MERYVTDTHEYMTISVSEKLKFRHMSRVLYEKLIISQLVNKFRAL